MKRIYPFLVALLLTIFCPVTIMAQDNTEITLTEPDKTEVNTDGSVNVTESETDILPEGQTERVSDESLSESESTVEQATEKEPEIEEEQDTELLEEEITEETVGADTDQYHVSIENGKYYINGPIPNITVQYKGRTLTKNKDYKIYAARAYKKINNIFEDTLEITGMGTYSGFHMTAPYTVYPISINQNTVTIATKNVSYEYTGANRCPKPIVYYIGDGKRTKLTAGKDYAISYKNNRNVGIATVSIKGKGYYTGSASCTYRIIPLRLSASNATAKTKSTSYVYTGYGRKPVPVVKADTCIQTKVTLINGQDFALSYKNNKNVGTATVTVVGKGNYSGSITTTFKLTSANIRECTVRFQKAVAYQPVKEGKVPVYFRTGNPVKPKLTIKYGDKILKEGTDYVLTYSNNVKMSKYQYNNKTKVFDLIKPAYVRVTGKGNYSGTLNKRFIIDLKTVSY